ncbi:hypothetical protein B296_00013445 [Ensete ventricosum]|uniref:Major facilitator superfamily (MFS) profile domain-containing protein n=1 Tax=Ensete ventricosum TaxID=4639 RepID=A0A427B3Q7_ENSVE|nr:hypothetical protein B296_00013445 [Ensete ventricosum]
MAGIRWSPEDADLLPARPPGDPVSDDDRSVAADSWSIKSDYGSTVDDDQRHADAVEGFSGCSFPAASDYRLPLSLSRLCDPFFYMNVLDYGCKCSSDKDAPDANEIVTSLMGSQSYWNATYAENLANLPEHGNSSEVWFHDLTGVDYSERAIELAKTLAVRGGFSYINFAELPTCYGQRDFGCHWATSGLSCQKTYPTVTLGGVDGSRVTTVALVRPNECCERLAYYGMSSNMVNYMKDRLHQENATAAMNNTNWSGTCYITPLLGAFIADAYLGRYRTIAGFMIIYILGLTMLTMTASVTGLKPACQNGVCHPTTAQSAAFFVSLYIIALGTGGIKPCVSSFGADQFDESDESEKKRKSSFFNWFYFTINVGSLVASTVIVWVQTYVGWGWGFGIPAVVMAVAVASFFFGTPLYRHQKPGGSPLTRIAQVVVASWRKRGANLPDGKSLLYEITEKESAIRGSRKLDHTDRLK